MGAFFEAVVARIRRALASPRAWCVAVCLAVLVTAPSLGAGIAADDHFHAVTIGDDPRWAEIHQPWWRLFTFYDGDPARTHFYVERGLSIWWTDPQLVASFFRPVAALTHLLDARIGAPPWLMHLHSIGWYALLVGLVAWVYRRLFTGHAKTTNAWVPGLAAVLFAFDHNHAMPAGWIANRNALVAAVFAVACLGAHDVAARSPSRRPGWAFASAVAFALALGAGESGLGAAGFLAAYAIFLDARTVRARALALAPHAAVGALWAYAYRAGGFGVRGSGMYLEPAREPVQWAAATLRHLPLLVASELGGLPPDPYPFLPTVGRVALVVVASAVLIAAAPAVTRAWRAEPLARFFAVGGVAAALPACAVFPASRLLTLPSFGLMALVAILGAAVVDDAAWIATRRRAWVRGFTLWACGGHLVLSPLVMQLGLGQMGRIGRFLDGLAADVPARPGDRDRLLVLMNAPDTLLSAYILLPRQLAGEDVPDRMLTLASGARDVVIERTDDRSVVVRAPGGFYRNATELVTRSAAMPVGTTVALADVTIEITHVCTDGVPDEASFRFVRSVDDATFLWRRWDGTKLVDVRAPAVGARVSVPGALPPVF